jgi:multicomponent K+:H+ antiporter subunit E
MNQWLPRLLLSGALFALWLVLNRSFAPADLLIAAVLAVALPRATAALRPWPVTLRRPGRLAVLVLHVGADVLASAAHVAGVLARGRAPHGAFVRIPLEMRDATALAALAVITTVTPGTIWSELAADRSALLLHVFDVEEEAAFVARYKDRYEKPLMEIFE